MQADSVVAILVIGLTGDGARHKQWALAQALEKILGPDILARVKHEYEAEGNSWDDVIAP